MTLVSKDIRRFSCCRSANIPRARAHLVGERGDRRVVGDVHDLSADPGVGDVVVGVGEFGLVPSGDDDSGSL
jgi:hypothetical protein